MRRELIRHSFYIQGRPSTHYHEQARISPRPIRDMELIASVFSWFEIGRFGYREHERKLNVYLFIGQLRELIELFCVFSVE